MKRLFFAALFFAMLGTPARATVTYYGNVVAPASGGSLTVGSYVFNTTGITLGTTSLTSTGLTVGSTTISALGAVVNGSIETNNGILEAPSGTTPLQICPNAVCEYQFNNGSGGNYTNAFIIHETSGNNALVFDSSGGITAIGGGNATVAGISGATLFLTNTTTQLLTLDGSGNQGIAGSYYSASSRSLKDHITPLLGTVALSWLERTPWSTFSYRSEHARAATHLGFIADTAPSAFAGPHHDHIDVNAVAAADGAAIVELHREVIALRAEVRRLEERR